MRSKSERWLLGLGLAYVLLMPVLVSAVIAWKDMPALIRALGGQTAAAWVQAIGSVAAVLGLFIVAKSEIDRAAHQRAKEAADRARLFLNLIGQLHEGMRMTVLAIKGGQPGIISPENLSTLVDMLNEIRLFDLPDERLSTSLVSLRRSAEFFKLHHVDLSEVLERKRKRIPEPDEAERRAIDPEFDSEEWRQFKVWVNVSKMDAILKDVERRLVRIARIRNEFAVRVGEPHPDIPPEAGRDEEPGGFVA